MSELPRIHAASPLIYSIMNEVAVNFAANGLLAIGATPSMSHTPKEAEEKARHADAVVLNLGTLTEERREAMMLAGKAANKAGVPVILDPVAVGSTEFRTAVAEEILKTVHVSAICGNAGEIAVLNGTLEQTKSPDSALETNDQAIAEKAADHYNTVILATGEHDVITDGNYTMLCHNGHPMLQHVTASGCFLTSLLAAFVSVADGEVYHSAIQAAASYGLAAERAVSKAEGPGTFIPALLDELYWLDEETIRRHQQIEER